MKAPEIKIDVEITEKAAMLIDEIKRHVKDAELRDIANMRRAKISIIILSSWVAVMLSAATWVWLAS